MTLVSISPSDAQGPLLLSSALPVLSPWGRIVHLAADTIRGSLPPRPPSSLRPDCRLLKAASPPCWSFSSESRRGMPGGSEEGPSESLPPPFSRLYRVRVTHPSIPVLPRGLIVPPLPNPPRPPSSLPPPSLSVHPAAFLRRLFLSLSPLGAYRSLSRGLSASLFSLSSLFLRIVRW